MQNAKFINIVQGDVLSNPKISDKKKKTIYADYLGVSHAESTVLQLKSKEQFEQWAKKLDEDQKKLIEACKKIGVTVAVPALIK